MKSVKLIFENGEYISVGPNYQVVELFSGPDPTGPYATICSIYKNILKVNKGDCIAYFGEDSRLTIKCSYVTEIIINY